MLKYILSKTLLPFLFWGVYASLRKTVVGDIPKENRLLVAFWHGKMTVGWLFAQTLAKPKTCVAVVSLSKDGSLLANALEQLNFKLIRGSSSRFKEIVKSEIRNTLNGEGIIAITPDGPRGPSKVFKYGTIKIASETQTPLIFLEIRCETYWQLHKSWDQFEIPKPFSKVYIIMHRIHIPRFENDTALKSFSDSLSNQFSKT